MAEFASKGVAGSGLGLGIAGTALGLLNGGLNGIGGLFNGTNTCSENCLVNRYELGQEQKISELQSQIALRDANTYNDQKMLELYKYFDGEIKNLKEAQSNKWTDQAVINCKMNSGLEVLSSQVTAISNTVSNITKTAVPTSAICNFNHGCGCNSCSIV